MIKLVTNHPLRLNRRHQSHRHERSQRCSQQRNARLRDLGSHQAEASQHPALPRGHQRAFSLLYHHRVLPAGRPEFAAEEAPQNARERSDGNHERYR